MLSSHSRRQAARVATAARGAGTTTASSTALRSSSRRFTTAVRSVTAAGTFRNLLSQRVLFYSTEKVLQLRTGRKEATGEALPKTLYRPDNERENCDVGLIASLKSEPSSRIIQQADEMLVRMAHRGGVGSDPASGDGSGTLLS
jgi:hypothetical protein